MGCEDTTPCPRGHPPPFGRGDWRLEEQGASSVVPTPFPGRSGKGGGWGCDSPYPFTPLITMP